MREPSDPADAMFRQLLNREILISERRRMLALARLLGVILALILLVVTFAPGFAKSIYHDRLPVRVALVAFPIFIVYELLAAALLTVLLRRGRSFPVFGRYANALVETSFPTLLLYLLAGYLPAPIVSVRGRRCSTFSLSFSRPYGSILRFTPSPEQSPRPNSSRSPP